MTTDREDLPDSGGKWFDALGEELSRRPECDDDGYDFDDSTHRDSSGSLTRIGRSGFPSERIFLDFQGATLRAREWTSCCHELSTEPDLYDNL